MKAINNISNWGDNHHPKILDLIRILLGVFLVLKGWVFFTNMAFLRDILLTTDGVKAFPVLIVALLYYITYVHLAGGILIVLGLFTRVVSILQIPIIFGAVFFVNIFRSPVNSELWLSILILALLMLFVVIGSGPLSLDHFLSDTNKSTTV